MRSATFITLIGLAACQGKGRSNAAATLQDSLDMIGFTPGDSADSVLLTPRVITGPTVVVFWLRSADTLPIPDQAAALDEMTYYTDRIAPTLARHEIKLVPTNADTVYVALPNNQRRPILLSGLDYPFGYLLIDPEDSERILAGVYADDELFDELAAYFDLPSDTTSARPRVTTL